MEETGVDLAFLQLSEAFATDAQALGAKLAKEAMEGEPAKAQCWLENLMFLRQMKQKCDVLWEEWRNRNSLSVDTEDEKRRAEEREAAMIEADDYRYNEEEEETEEEPSAAEPIVVIGRQPANYKKKRDLSKYRLPVLLTLYNMPDKIGSPAAIRRLMNSVLPDFALTLMEMMSVKRTLDRQGMTAGGHGVVALTPKGRELAEVHLKDFVDRNFRSIEVFKG